MHRDRLNELLLRYRRAWPGEGELVDRFVAFAATYDDCLLRTCLVGHITASCWIVDPSQHRVLLTHHKKLGRWLQLGGHVDGEAAVERAALREAQEESGIEHFEMVRWHGAELVPLDLDVHLIPARPAEPAHDHWDVRFALQVPHEQPLVLSAESNDLRWIEVAQLQEHTGEESVLRLGRKARQLGLHA